MRSSYGGQGGNRTPDASLFRAALYHLSYLANLDLQLQVGSVEPRPSWNYNNPRGDEGRLKLGMKKEA